MLALQQALEIKESILAYLRATYSFQDKRVQKAFFDFVEDPVDGVFKGPYVSLKLPFVQATPEEEAGIPLTIKPDWPAYDHQVKAWHRLSTKDERQPQPTLITTGTGSGKTESFLYPFAGPLPPQPAGGHQGDHPVPDERLGHRPGQALGRDHIRR